jgi:competence protein ComEA
LVAIAIGALSARHRSEYPAESPVVVTPPALQGPLELNHADVAALEALPRIGPSLARRIVEDRERNGPFHAVEELERVHGIGPATVETLRPLITIDAASSP